MQEIGPENAEAVALREVLGRFATGVTVVSIAGEGGQGMGFTANSFASVSLEPPLVLWSPARSSSRFAAFAAARHYVIHVLAEGQTDLLARFARGGAGFDGLPWSINAEGVPLIAGALARIHCVQHATHDGGDHLIIVGRVLRAEREAGAPLVFSQGRYGRFSPF